MMKPSNHTKSNEGGAVSRVAGKDPDRRDFLCTALPAGVLCGMGCPKLSALLLEHTRSDQSLQEKAASDSGMSYAEVFDFAYRGGFIPVAKKMMESMGKEAFLEVLGSASSDVMRDLAAATAEEIPSNDLAAFAQGMKTPDSLYQHALSYEIVEDSEQAFEVRINVCLWAKTFRESGASEIGYASICHPDYAFAEGFNPSLRMVRSKTLMQGDECCNHRWEIVD